MSANTPKIVALSGSGREKSYNKQLVRVAAGYAKAEGAEVEVLDLKELALPLFDQDLEAAGGLPDGARRLKAALAGSDGILISSPEYNSSVTPALKNAIDWASRATSEDEPPLAAFRGKTALLLAASPGGLGGLRGLVHLRAILGNIGVVVLPDQLAVGAAHEAFSADGSLADARKAAQLQGMVSAFVAHLRRNKA